MDIQTVKKVLEEKQVDMTDDNLLLDEEVEKTMDLRQVQEEIKEKISSSGDTNE